MVLRYAFVDDCLVAREFKSGDIVRKAGYRDFVLSPYVGLVIYSNVDTGKVHVQWPWGAEESPASELVIDRSESFEPPLQMDQSYSTHEMSRHINSPSVMKADEKWRKSLSSTIIKKYEDSTLPIWRAACEAWHCEMPEIETYTRMATVFGNEYGQEAIRLTIANLYELGRRLAIYWAGPPGKRRYKTTQQEKKTGKYICPRCHGRSVVDTAVDPNTAPSTQTYLKPRKYQEGKHVYLCKNCGFTIDPKSII